MQRFFIIRLFLMALSVLVPCGANALKFCDHGPAKDLVAVDVHALFGGAAISQNYMGCFSEIREINATMGTAWGAGVTAEFGFRDYLGIGTQLNVIFNTNSVNVAVSNFNATSVSNVFLHNHYNYINVPVYATFKFNITENLRWNVDAGFYYGYGFSGWQRQAAYTSTVNELGQLVNRVTVTKPDYFKNPDTFVNSYRRSDAGIHLSTGLIIFRHYRIGLRSTIGLKNVSTVGENGIINPNIHNFNLMMEIGYRF